MVPRTPSYRGVAASGNARGRASERASERGDRAACALRGAAQGRIQSKARWREGEEVLHRCSDSEECVCLVQRAKLRAKGALMQSPPVELALRVRPKECGG